MLSSAAVVLAAVAGWWWLGGGVVALLERTLRGALVAAAHPPESPVAALGDAGWATARALTALLALPLLVGGLAAFLQVGPLFTSRPLAPRAERLDAARGLRRIGSSRSLIELLFATSVLVGVAVTTGVTLRAGLAAVASAPSARAAGLLGTAVGLASAVLLRAGVVVAGLAVLDLVYRRWRHRKDLRMTRRELERERRETEGDPYAKEHRARAHRRLASGGRGAGST